MAKYYSLATNSRNSKPVSGEREKLCIAQYAFQEPGGQAKLLDHTPDSSHIKKMLVSYDPGHLQLPIRTRFCEVSAKNGKTNLARVTRFYPDFQIFVYRLV